MKPFPGMNPYLEAPDLWSEVYSRLIVAIADALSECLSQAYRVAIEKRVYLSEGEESVAIGIPDVSVLSQPSAPTEPTDAVATAEPVTVTIPMPETVQEWYLEIREVSTGAVITSIEVLSPTNKKPGVGRQAYERKRLQVLASQTHLVEIDLLRRGEPLPAIGAARSDYRVLVSRSWARPTAQLYGFTVRQRLPVVKIPLKPGEAEVELDLQEVLEGLIRRGRYHLAIDDSVPPDPPLNQEDLHGLERWRASLE
ncbi:DUF4058 family protein [Geitlerinema sp. CS-897]|nr:DUF4058 family protein [Geitlerinema sp. CS-897]